MPCVLVIIPTHSNSETLSQALKSVQVQTHRDIEVQIIADGATPKVIEIARNFSSEDSRFQLQIHEKSLRRGEEFRHATILNSRAELITYLTDDDLFLPHHVQYMRENMEGYDFVNPRPTFINRSDTLWCMPTDISCQSSREWQLSDRIVNSIGLSGVMHTKNSYLQLSEGWTSTPSTFPYTDLYMWRKFLSRKDFKFKTTTKCTILKFLGDSNEYDFRKIEQNLEWFEKIQEPGWIEKWHCMVERTHQKKAAELFSR